MDEYKKTLKAEVVKMVQSMTEDHNIQMAMRDSELNNEFQFQMKLARGELYEEFWNEKLKLDCWKKKRLEALERDNHRALLHLRASLEAEWIEEINALELWYETENQNLPVVEVIGDRALTSLFEIDDYTTQVRILEKRLSVAATELAVYERRLQHVLGGYIDLVDSGLSKYPDLQRTQLHQAKTLMANLNEIWTCKNRFKVPKRKTKVHSPEER